MDNNIRAYEMDLVGIRDTSVRELFSGFDSLKAITFSIGAGFVDGLLGLFHDAQIEKVMCLP